MSNAMEVTSTNFEAEVLKSDRPVLVDFWAPWCGPCLMMAPVLDEIASELEGKIKIVKVNVELTDNQAMSAEYGIQSIPNMKLFKDGKVAAEFIGARSKDTLVGELQAWI